MIVWKALADSRSVGDMKFPVNQTNNSVMTNFPFAELNKQA
jgi:hypothetical protein